MADGFVQVPADSVGKRIDASELTVGGQTVERQRIGIADPSGAAAIAAVGNVKPGATDYGLVTRDANFSATGTQTNVTSVATDTTILAANAARLNAMIFNDSTAILYLLFASATSSATIFSVKVAPGDLWVMDSIRYTGVVKGIWSAANGAARITEFT